MATDDVNKQDQDEEARLFRVDLMWVRCAVDTFLVKWWGERCKEFEPTCALCQKWKAVDCLLDNPFEEEGK